jgi:soluble lytic murein transglycosylase-like protein
MLPQSIGELVARVSQEEGVDEALVRAVVQAESGGNPNAVSPKGAMGLMQLMPQTARAMGVQNPFDPEQNLRGGVRLLRGLLDEFGDVRLALAAYNAGGPAVRRYGGIPPYAETQKFVQRVHRACGRVNDDEAVAGDNGGASGVAGAALRTG